MQPAYEPRRNAAPRPPWLGCGIAAGCALFACIGIFTGLAALGAYRAYHPPQPEAPGTWSVFRSYVIRYDGDHGGATVRCPNCGGTGRKLNPYVGHEAPCMLCRGTGVWHGRFPQLVILDDPARD